MAQTASPYGLRAAKMTGGQAFNGSMTGFTLSTNNSAAMAAGDIIQLTSAGNPQALAATITAGTTSGVVGVCNGFRYVTPGEKKSRWGQYLPANAITAGYTDIEVMVVDDPDVLFKVQGSAALGTLTNGAAGARGKNAALGNFSAQNAATGRSGVNLVVGTNGGSLALTATLAVRIVDVVPGTETDPYPEFLVRFNGAAHSYNFATGV